MTNNRSPFFGDGNLAPYVGDPLENETPGLVPDLVFRQPVSFALPRNGWQCPACQQVWNPDLEGCPTCNESAVRQPRSESKRIDDS